ncbi:MAG: type IV secretory system conjugative DNA transfer family protein [Planctomycetes bacterium]|nr:type IV secretory system conjugative DNA transfer family protein [Planctomycetota bacterium]
MAATLAFIASLCVLATRVSPVLVVMVFIVLCAVAKRRSMQLDAFGTARWADDDDLRRADMLDGDSGLVLGRMESERPRFRTGLRALFNLRLRSRTACHVFLRSLGFWRGETHLVRLRNAVHTTVFAPTGAGKGVSIVIPTLLTCMSSMVVVDIKGELVRLTAEHRRRMGFRVVVLDPFRIATHSPDTLNVLDYLDASDTDLIDRCRDIAEAMVVRSANEKEPHWSDSAVIWISAIILVVVLFGEPGERSLQTVRRLLTDPAQMEAAVKLLCSSDACDGIASRLGHQLAHFKDKELSSVLTTVSRHMRFLDTPAVAASTRTSTFDPADIKGEKVTVYLCLAPDHVRAQSGLLRLWVETLSRAVVKGGVRG